MSSTGMQSMRRPPKGLPNWLSAILVVAIFANVVLGHRECHSQTFIAMPPISVVDSVEEVVSRDDQHVALFQPLVQLQRCNGKSLEPHPKEEGSFAAVDSIVE